MRGRARVMSTVQSSLRIVAHCGNRHRRTPLAANLLVLAACSVAGAAGPARAPLPDPCARPAPGSAVPEPQSVLPTSHEPLPAPTLAWLGSVTPTRVRRLYFLEKLDDPNNPNSATTFYITVDRQTPRPFDPRSSVPNIVVTQGDVEDWIIENRSTELHAFTRFTSCSWNGQDCRSTRPLCVIRSMCLTSTAGCCSIRACACVWIFAIRMPSERSCITATYWSTRMAA
jgi:hypothetical protein